jgi:hypothetical protein
LVSLAHALDPKPAHCLPKKGAKGSNGFRLGVLRVRDAGKDVIDQFSQLQKTMENERSGPRIGVCGAQQLVALWPRQYAGLVLPGHQVCVCLQIIARIRESVAVHGVSEV